MQRHFLFGPAPWGPGEGPKGQISLIIIKFQLQSQFQRFFKQTLCVFSHMKDIKTYQTGFSFGRLGHAPGVGLRGTVGGWGVKFFFFEIQPDLVCELLTCMAHAPAPFLGPRPLGPWGGAKMSNIIKSELQSQLQRFLNQTLCIFSQMKDI